MNIEMKGINKSFGTNQVLKNAGFFLKDGEVHALMGENGAGKSTLMKILTGVYTKDSGTVYVDGEEVSYKTPQEAEKAGIVFIYQELNVLFDLTVVENLFMGRFFGDVLDEWHNDTEHLERGVTLEYTKQTFYRLELEFDVLCEVVEPAVILALINLEALEELNVVGILGFCESFFV